MSLGESLNQSWRDGVGIGESGRVKFLTDMRVFMSEIQIPGYPMLSLSLGNHKKAEAFSDPCVLGFSKCSYCIIYRQTWLSLPPRLGG